MGEVFILPRPIFGIVRRLFHRDFHFFSRHPPFQVERYAAVQCPAAASRAKALKSCRLFRIINIPRNKNKKNRLSLFGEGGFSNYLLFLPVWLEVVAGRPLDASLVPNLPVLASLFTLSITSSFLLSAPPRRKSRPMHGVSINDCNRPSLIPLRAYSPCLFGLIGLHSLERALLDEYRMLKLFSFNIPFIHDAANPKPKISLFFEK